MKEHQYNLKMEEELFEWLRVKAFQNKKSIAEMIRRILWVEMQIDRSADKTQLPEKLPELVSIKENENS